MWHLWESSGPVLMYRVFNEAGFAGFVMAESANEARIILASQKDWGKSRYWHVQLVKNAFLTEQE